MATLEPGATFEDGELVNSSDINSIVADGVIKDVVASELASGTKAMEISSSAPSDTSNTIWFDSTNMLLRRYVSSQSVWAPYGYGIAVTNNTGSLIAKGSVVVISGADNEIDYNVTLAHQSVAGVLQADIGDGSSGVIQTHGMGSILVTGDVSRGQNIIASSITGRGVGTIINRNTVSDNVTAGAVLAIASHEIMGSGLVTCYFVQ